MLAFTLMFAGCITCVSIEFLILSWIDSRMERRRQIDRRRPDVKKLDDLMFEKRLKAKR